MAARPSISEMGPLVQQKGQPLPREPVALPRVREPEQEETLPEEPEAPAQQVRAVSRPPAPIKPPQAADLLARYRPEPKIPRETVSVKITKPTLERLEAFIDATKAQRQTVWEDALTQLLDRMGF